MIWVQFLHPLHYLMNRNTRSSPTFPVSSRSTHAVNQQKWRFRPYWTYQFPWVQYSKALDGVFCALCVLFSRARFNNEFVSSPFHNWKNATGTSRGGLNRNSLSQTHQQWVEQAASFLAIMEKNQKSIKFQLSKAYDNQAQAQWLLAIIDSIQFLIQ